MKADCEVPLNEISFLDLDKLVAEKVLGWSPMGADPATGRPAYWSQFAEPGSAMHDMIVLPHFTTSVSSAFSMLLSLPDAVEWTINHCARRPLHSRYRCLLHRPETLPSGSILRKVYPGDGATLPLAMVRSALAMHGVQVP